MTGPTTFVGLIRRLLAHVWDRIRGAFWIVECDACRLQFGAVASRPGEPGKEFRHREEADDAARAAGWLIEGGKTACPACCAKDRERAACGVVKQTTRTKVAEAYSDHDLIHIVGGIQHWLDRLRLKIPRALCGVPLEGNPDRPGPSLYSPVCPKCAELDRTGTSSW